jgi:cell division protein FtsW
MTRQSAQSRTGPDPAILALVLALATWGLLTLYSVSQPMKEGPMFFLSRQVVFVAIGMGLMLLIGRIDLTVLNNRKVIVGLLAICGLLLVAVWIPGLADPGKNAHRWVKLGVRLQPSELTKAVMVLFFAHWIADAGEKIREPLRGFLPMTGVTLFFAALIVIEPDLGGAAVIGALLFVMLFLAGIQKRWLAVYFFAFMAAVGSLIWVAPYRLKRLLAFMSPTSENLLNVNWQQWQAKIAIGVGGVSGVGFGNGWQKAYYVPEMHTDFILANVGEEWGLLGMIAVCVLFFALIWRAIRLTARTGDAFLRHVGIGAATLLGLQVVINACVVMGMLPNKGLSLPFFSAGGSNTLLNFMLAGMILSAARCREVEVVGQTRVLNVLARRQLAGAAGD